MAGTKDSFRIGIVSGKLGDVDGVSLEVDKWINILQDEGHEIFTISGKFTTPLDAVPKANRLLLEKIRFNSPEQKKYEKQFFPFLSKHPPYNHEEMTKRMVEEMLAEGSMVANMMHEFVQTREIDVVIGQNTNAMPMTLLGAIGLHKMAVDDRVATLFHHHDFWWERSRFSFNRIEALLNDIMPPADFGIEHIVISSYAAHILRSLKRVQPHVIPNCEDFDHPVWLDDYNRSFREDFGFREDDILIVQPTRIVQRKRIEDAIELLGRFIERYPKYRDRIQYIISLYQGDEPDENYIGYIREMAESRDIPLHMISDKVSSIRGTGADGKKLYTNRDVLANADLVTYLPIWEGFGNALLEAIAAKVPVITTTYLVYKTDIMVAGFDNIEIRDRYDDNERLIITDAVLDRMEYVLTHPAERRQMVEKNFTIGNREFSYKTLRQRLCKVLDEYGDEIRASRRRIRKSRLRYSV
jgi:mannosylglucosylglycerate synthase